MRIDLNSPSQVPESKPDNAQAARRSTANCEKEAGLPDSAASPTGIGRLTHSALAAPEARMDKVEALRQQVAAGTYHIRPGQIAASILDALNTNG